MKDKKILYPQKLTEEHNKLMNLIKVIEDEANDRLIQERLKSLNQNTYQDNKYIVFPAYSVACLINESQQMNHCVKTYAKRYALGETDIYMLREITKQDKSLVTVEIKNNRILQARTKNNGDPNEEQLNFLNSWHIFLLKHLFWNYK